MLRLCQPLCVPIPNNHHKLQTINQRMCHGISFSFVAIWICSSSFFVYDDICYLFLPITLLGNWKQAEPSGCATKCGVAAGKSGTPGAVSCNTTSCDPDTKPAAKQCPKTVDCGTFDTDMPIVLLLLLHHRHILFFIAAVAPLAQRLNANLTNPRTRDPAPLSPY